MEILCFNAEVIAIFNEMITCFKKKAVWYIFFGIHAESENGVKILYEVLKFGISLKCSTLFTKKTVKRYSTVFKFLTQIAMIVLRAYIITKRMGVNLSFSPFTRTI